jgi:type IX secretion system PorP/SprF family membrane protein
MRKSLRIFYLLLLMGLAVNEANAQVDPHFSQYYVYPAWLNPSLTGAFDGQYRVSGIYRTQWGNISSPFATFGVSGEVTTDKNINIGASVMRQSAGDGGYHYTTAYGNIAYTGARFGVNQSKRLVFGIQAGVIQRRFDRSKLTFGDQWNPITGFNPGTPTSDFLTRNSAAALDIGAGVMYFDAQPGKKANVFGGFSASHITQPEDKFSASGTAKFPARYTVHGGIRLAVNSMFSITPNFLYLKQGTAQEKMIGAYGQYRATDDLDLMMGINYRVEDAISPFLGFTYKNLMLGASYDINTSDLGKMANGSNSFEISISFIGRKTTKTPEVEFVCPRL